MVLMVLMKLVEPGPEPDRFSRLTFDPLQTQIPQPGEAACGIQNLLLKNRNQSWYLGLVQNQNRV